MHSKHKYRSACRKSIFMVLCGLLISANLDAQHFQFSQFYVAPTYLNPAFAGANVCSRLSLNYRRQWVGIPGSFTTYQLSLDHSLTRMKSGIGIQFLNDVAGTAGITTNQVNLLYSYEVRVNKRIAARGGLSVGGVQRRANLSTFTFADQISRESNSSVEKFAAPSASYMDLGAGILVYSSNYWFGISVGHMNQPDQTLLNGFSALPRELKLQGGYKFLLGEGSKAARPAPDDASITIAYNYKRQNKFNQLDLGFYVSKNVLVLGCWYRGMPLYKPDPFYQNNDAVILLFGLSMNKYKIGYSYDFTISKLAQASTLGSHEISMSYQFCNLKKGRKRRMGLISCPKF